MILRNKSNDFLSQPIKNKDIAASAIEFLGKARPGFT